MSEELTPAQPKPQGMPVSSASLTDLQLKIEYRFLKAENEELRGANRVLEESSLRLSDHLVVDSAMKTAPVIGSANEAAAAAAISAAVAVF